MHLTYILSKFSRVHEKVNPITLYILDQNAGLNIYITLRRAFITQITGAINMDTFVSFIPNARIFNDSSYNVKEEIVTLI